MSRTGFTPAESAAVLRFWEESQPPVAGALLHRLARLFEYDALVEVDANDLLTFLQGEGEKVYLEGVKCGDIRPRLAELHDGAPVSISSALLIVFLMSGDPITSEGVAVRAMMADLRNAVPNATILHWVVFQDDLSSPVKFDLIVTEGFPEIPLSNPEVLEMTSDDIPRFLRKLG